MIKTKKQNMYEDIKKKSNTELRGNRKIINGMKKPDTKNKQTKHARLTLG